MKFAQPELLWLLALLPPLMWMYLRTGERGALLFPDLATIDAVAQSAATRRRVRLRRWLPLLRALALALAVAALARPQAVTESTRVYREGIAIGMVVDISSSMGALDLVDQDDSSNRLEVVKRTFRSFIAGDPDTGQEGRRGDLISMVTFARYADLVSPLTADHRALLALLDGVTLASLREEDGTAIGDGIIAGIDTLRDSSAASRVLITLTDGSNNAGTAPPMTAAAAAKALGIRVYTVGAGSDGMTMMPARGRDGSIEMRPAQVYIDEFTLERVAQATGGKYYRAEDAQTLSNIYAEIDQLEKARQVLERQPTFIELGPWLLLAAFVLLALELAARYTVVRTAPVVEAV